MEVHHSRHRPGCSGGEVEPDLGRRLRRLVGNVQTFLPRPVLQDALAEIVQQHGLARLVTHRRPQESRQLQEPFWLGVPYCPQ
jgi:hypothetical protein